MEQYENLMRLFRRECQYAGAARWVLDATLKDLIETAEAEPSLKDAINRLKFRLESLDLEYNQND